MQTPEILYEDDQILVCRKNSAGVPVQTKKIGTQDMESILKNYLFIHSSHHAGHKPPYLAVIPQTGSTGFRRRGFCPHTCGCEKSEPAVTERSI